MKEGENFDQQQVHDLLFNREIGWQDIIYDLINTEQLDPWNVNIVVLSEGFLSKIQEYEETDFFVSSKVLLAAALLLRIKSEMILSRFMKSIDEILFGESEKQSSALERIELDEEIPDLIPKTPIARSRKVTLQELIENLNKAIMTENRRIKKEIVNKNALRETGLSLPKKKFNITNKLKFLHSKVQAHFEANRSHKKVTYTKIVGEDREEKAMSFFPMLQLESNGHVWLEQENHFEEIHIWLKHIFLKHNPNPYQDLMTGEWEEETLRDAVQLTEENFEESEQEEESSQ